MKFICIICVLLTTMVKGGILEHLIQRHSGWRLSATDSNYCGVLHTPEPVSQLIKQRNPTSAAKRRVTFITPEGERVVECEEDEYLLDVAEEQGINIPYSCRAGSCSTCVGLLKEGQVDDSEQAYLDEEQKAKGFVLTCCSYPKSDCVIETHHEQSLY